MRLAWDWRGANSFRACFRHMNVLKKGSDLAWRRPGFCEITCCDPSQFAVWPAKDVYIATDILLEASARVENGDLAPARLEELVKAFGLNVNPLGVLAAKDLRPFVDPTGCTTFDWMHNNLQDGVMTCEIQLLLAACEPYGLTRAQVKADLKDARWSFPSHFRVKSRQLWRVFESYRQAADPNRVRASASELLGVYVLLRYIVASRLHRVDELRKHLASFDAACKVLDIILSMKRGTADVSAAAAVLQAAMVEHMQLHMSVYGDGNIRPKHHWNLDIPGQVLRDGVVLDCIADSFRLYGGPRFLHHNIFRTDVLKQQTNLDVGALKCELPYDVHSNTATIGLLHHRTHTLASEGYRRFLHKPASMGKVSTGWHAELLLVIRQSRFFQSLVAWAYRQGRQRSLGLVHDDDIRMPHRGWRYRQALRCMWRRPSLFAGRCSLVCCSRDHGQGR